MSGQATARNARSSAQSKIFKIKNRKKGTRAPQEIDRRSPSGGKEYKN